MAVERSHLMQERYPTPFKQLLLGNGLILLTIGGIFHGRFIYIHTR